MNSLFQEALQNRQNPLDFFLSSSSYQVGKIGSNNLFVNEDRYRCTDLTLKLPESNLKFTYKPDCSLEMDYLNPSTRNANQNNQGFATDPTGYNFALQTGPLVISSIKEFLLSTGLIPSSYAVSAWTYTSPKEDAHYGHRAVTEQALSNLSPNNIANIKTVTRGLYPSIPEGVSGMDVPPEASKEHLQKVGRRLAITFASLTSGYTSTDEAVHRHALTTVRFDNTGKAILLTPAETTEEIEKTLTKWQTLFSDSKDKIEQTDWTSANTDPQFYLNTNLNITTASETSVQNLIPYLHNRLLQLHQALENKDAPTARAIMVELAPLFSAAQMNGFDNLDGVPLKNLQKMGEDYDFILATVCELETLSNQANARRIAGYPMSDSTSQYLETRSAKLATTLLRAIKEDHWNQMEGMIFTQAKGYYAVVASLHLTEDSVAHKDNAGHQLTINGYGQIKDSENNVIAYHNDADSPAHFEKIAQHGIDFTGRTLVAFTDTPSNFTNQLAALFDSANTEAMASDGTK